MNPLTCPCCGADLLRVGSASTRSGCRDCAGIVVEYAGDEHILLAAVRALPCIDEIVVGLDPFSGGADGWRLGAVSGGTDAWRGGTRVEAKHWERHEAPAPGCRCGFNGLYALGGDRSYGAKVERYSYTVWGAFLGDGIVEAHCDGARTQFAQPIALAYVDWNDWEEVQEIANIDVPLVGSSRVDFKPRIRWRHIVCNAPKRDVVEAAGQMGIAAVPFDRLADFAFERGVTVPVEHRASA